MRFHFGWKSHCRVQSTLYLCLHELWQNETQNGMDLILVNLTEMKFQTGMRFSCEHNLPETKTNKCWLVGFCHYCTCAFETQCGYGFHISHFDRNDIPFWLIKYHVNTTQNEMPTHVHQTIGSFWNAGKMKLHVNRTCFYAGLKSQTGMSLFCLSCERTLR